MATSGWVLCQDKPGPLTSLAAVSIPRVCSRWLRLSRYRTAGGQLTPGGWPAHLAYSITGPCYGLTPAPDSTAAIACTPPDAGHSLLLPLSNLRVQKRPFAHASFIPGLMDAEPLKHNTVNELLLQPCWQVRHLPCLAMVCFTAVLKCKGIAAAPCPPQLCPTLPHPGMPPFSTTPTPPCRLCVCVCVLTLSQHHGWMCPAEPSGAAGASGRHPHAAPAAAHRHLPAASGGQRQLPAGHGPPHRRGGQQQHSPQPMLLGRRKLALHLTTQDRLWSDGCWQQLKSTLLHQCSRSY